MDISNKKKQNRGRKHKSIEEILKDLNRSHVKIKKGDRKRNNIILYSVLGELLKIMQRHNKLFHSMKPKLEYLGSYFDRLRVGKPTEYDINVVLKLPVNYNKINLDASKAHCDCTHIYTNSEFRRLSKTPTTASQGFSQTERWCDANYRLSVKKFRSWMQGVVDAAIASLLPVGHKRTLCVQNKSFSVASKTSGPACTITITELNNESNLIDVDLVPTLAFELPKRPHNSGVLFDFIEKEKLKMRYFVVPKPTEDEFSWRLAFPLQERQLMNNKNNLKSAVKLLKLLRDAQDFKQLSSYYIKTLFLWETKNRSVEFWKYNSLTYLVLHMLKLLKECLAKAEINNFWCPTVNLLKNKNINVDTCHQWSNRLSVIINNIDNKGRDNPYIIKEYFIKKNTVCCLPQSSPT